MPSRVKHGSNRPTGCVGSSGDSLPPENGGNRPSPLSIDPDPCGRTRQVVALRRSLRRNRRKALQPRERTCTRRKEKRKDGKRKKNAGNENRAKRNAERPGSDPFPLTFSVLRFTPRRGPRGGTPSGVSLQLPQERQNRLRHQIRGSQGRDPGLEEDLRLGERRGLLREVEIPNAALGGRKVLDRHLD